MSKDESHMILSESGYPYDHMIRGSICYKGYWLIPYSSRYWAISLLN